MGCNTSGDLLSLLLQKNPYIYGRWSPWCIVHSRQLLCWCASTRFYEWILYKQLGPVVKSLHAASGFDGQGLFAGGIYIIRCQQNSSRMCTSRRWACESHHLYGNNGHAIWTLSDHYGQHVALNADATDLTTGHFVLALVVVTFLW